MVTLLLIVSHGKDIDSRFSLLVMFSVVVIGHLSQSTLWRLVLKTLVIVLGPRPKLQFSILGRVSNRSVSRMLREEKFADASLGSPVRMILSIDSSDEEEIMRRLLPGAVSRDLIDLTPLISIS